MKVHTDETVKCVFQLSGVSQGYVFLIEGSSRMNLQGEAGLSQNALHGDHALE